MYGLWWKLKLHEVEAFNCLSYETLFVFIWRIENLKLKIETYHKKLMKIYPNPWQGELKMPVCFVPLSAHLPI